MATRHVVLTSALVVAFVRPALAIVVDPPMRVHDAPLPANGVLLFASGTAGDQGTVSVSGSDGAVPGSTNPINVNDYYFGWRADDPPEPGIYDWSLGNSTYLVTEGSKVAIVEPYEPEAHELNLALVLEPKQVYGGKLVCCEPDPQSRTLGNGCVYTEVTQVPQLRIFYSSPLPPEHATQYLYRISEAPERPDLSSYEGWFSADTAYQSAFEVIPADEYCVTVEAHSLIDEQIFSTTRCVPHTLPEPTFSPRASYYRAFSLASCPEPPQGFEDEWCQALESVCTTDVRYASSPEDVVASCKDVYERCGFMPPALPDAGSPIAGSADAGAPDASDEGDEDDPGVGVNPTQPKGDPPAFACSCRLLAPRSPAAGWAGTALLAVWITVRRGRRRARSLPVG